MTTRNSLLIVLLAALAAGLAMPAAASGPLAVCQTGQPWVWPNGGANIVYNPETGPFVGDPDPLLSIRTAFDQWENVATSTISFIQGPTIPDVTGANLGLFFGQDDGLSPIMLDDDGTIAIALGFPPGVLGLGGLEVVKPSTCEVDQGLFIIFSSVGDVTGFRDVATHEAGHFNNMGHTVTNGNIYDSGDATGPSPNNTFGTAPDPFANDTIETMYPFYFGGTSSSVTLHRDDIAFISTLYPAPGFFANSGTISGTILAANGTTKLSGANVIARNVANPFFDAVSAISGDFTDDFSQGNPFAGVFTINGLTPGAQYAVYVDQIQAGSFGVPPLALLGPEEFYNGANEANANPPDDPSVFTAVTAVAGSPATGIDIIFNQPAPGDPLGVGDDGFVELALPFTYTICGQDFETVFIHANGFISFGAGIGGINWVESVPAFLDGPPRVAGLWDDLNPTQGGIVTFDQTSNTFTAVYQDVPEWFASGSNSFEITLHKASDHVDIDYGNVSITDGLAGVSCGSFVTSGFETGSDLSSFAPQRINLQNQPAAYELFSFSNPNDLANSTVRFNGTTNFNDNWAEFNDSIAKARNVKLPFDSADARSRFTEIDPAGGDIDFYAFDLTGSTTLVAEITGGNLDSLIGLFDSAGTLVAVNDDGGAGLLSRIVYSVPADGEYFLAVTTFPDFDFDGDGGSGGRYVLDLSAIDGTLVVLGDDNFVNVGLGFTFPFQGSNYNDVYVNANGNLTFGAGDTNFINWTENVPDFLNGPPRIAGLWDDLSPNAGGLVFYNQSGGCFNITFQGVPEFPSSGSNTFAISFDSAGNIGLDYGALSASDGLAGITQGGGATDPGESDLSTGSPFSTSGTTYEIFTSFDNDLGGASVVFGSQPACSGFD